MPQNVLKSAFIPCLGTFEFVPKYFKEEHQTFEVFQIEID